MKFIDAISLPGKLIRLFAVFIAALTLGACGGGDGFPGVHTAPDVPVTALYTTAPGGGVTIAAAGSGVYTVGGGTPGYSASTSNSAVATATLVDTTLTVNGVSGGSATVEVRDAAGATVSLSVTVKGAKDLFTTAPAGGVTIGTGGTGVYTIGGGTPGYSAVTNHSSVATANVVGSTLTINGLSAGAATIVVSDAAGATMSLAVTVESAKALFTTAPSSLTIAPAAAPTYTIGGGSAPYVVNSSNVAVATASVNGTTLTITGVAEGAAQIVVLDSSGAQTAIGLTVARSASGPLFTTAPSAITIATGAAPSYAISGGSAPYTVVSSNVLVATTNVTTGTTLNIVGLATGTANVVLTDTTGKTLTIAVTVSSASSTPLVVTPSTASATVGDVLTFRVSGGSPAYGFIVNNTSMAAVFPASVTSSGGTFTVVLYSAGTTTVAVVDALGQTATVSLTVAAQPVVAPPVVTVTPLALSPSALTIGETYASPIALNIQHGTGPYKAFTSDLVLSSVSVTGSTLTVGLGTQGNRCITPSAAYGTYDITITVVDALGASAVSTLTIKDTNGTCP